MSCIVMVYGQIWYLMWWIIWVAAKLGKDVTLGNGCIIGVGMDLKGVKLTDKVHMYTHDGMIQQRTGTDLPAVSIANQIWILKSLCKHISCV